MARKGQSRLLGPRGPSWIAKCRGSQQEATVRSSHAPRIIESLTQLQRRVRHLARQAVSKTVAGETAQGSTP